ncbi:hypothetical protein ISS04_03285 [Candidatus Woesearchaeota archaeon]|nr:hypothetical protein [Candidatus Woesearchaeota archaeon]
MKIDFNSYENFLSVLEESKEIKRELGSFGLYLPSEDRVLTSIPFKDILSDLVEKSNEYQLKFNRELISDINAFNQGIKENLSLAQYQFNQKDGKIFSYHTHPIEDQEIVPSHYDRTELINMQSPLELVISAQAQEYWPKTPFVAGYHKDYFPEHKKDFSKSLNMTESEFRLEAKKMEMPYWILWQLSNTKRNTELYPSIDFEIEKP